MGRNQEITESEFEPEPEYFVFESKTESLVTILS